MTHARRALLVSLLLLASPIAHADAPVENRVSALERDLAQMKAAYEARIAALETEITLLKKGPARPPAGSQGQAGLLPPGGEAPPPAPPAAAPGQEESPTPQQAQGIPPAPLAPPPPVLGGELQAPPPPGGTSQTSNYFNPSIAMIGNFLAIGGTNTVDDAPAASLRESELGLQAIVDPYARADFFISFGEEGVEVEEGFITFTSLPAGFLAKVGRMRTSFGKINTLHLHVLPWPDEPLPIVNLLGGDEGWVGTGASVAHLVPMPADIFSEVTLQVFRGDAGELFQQHDRGDLSYNAHYRLFKDLSEAVNLDFGLSYGAGPNASADRARTNLDGVDATLRWKPLRTATYRSASMRGEYIRSTRDQPGGPARANGWFVSGEYQLAKRWFLGGRYEAADHADDPSARDRGQAALLTFWPSEFSQIRGEFRRRSYSDVETANEFLLQVQFAIGAHGAHPF